MCFNSVSVSPLDRAKSHISKIDMIQPCKIVRFKHYFLKEKWDLISENSLIGLSQNKYKKNKAKTNTRSHTLTNIIKPWSVYNSKSIRVNIFNVTLVNQIAKGLLGKAFDFCDYIFYMFEDFKIIIFNNMYQIVNYTTVKYNENKLRSYIKQIFSLLLWTRTLCFFVAIKSKLSKPIQRSVWSVAAIL